MTKTKYVEELFSNQPVFNEEMLVKALSSYITIKPDTKQVYFKSLEGLSAQDQIIVFGMAKKILKMNDFIETENFSPSEFKKQFNLKKSTVDVSFKRLRDKGLLIGEGENHEVPNYEIENLIDLLNQKKHKDKK